MPWWQRTVYVEGIAEELTGMAGQEYEPEQQQEPGDRTRVLDLDDDGFESLTQFGMRMQAV